MNKFRSRKFCLLLYPEDEMHMTAIGIIKLSYDYAMICHNQDYDDNGELKKEHYHIVLSLPNAVWNTALAKDLGIEVNYIQHCRNENLALGYLIHFNDEDKYQYDVDEVKGNLKSKLIKYMTSHDKSEDDKGIELLDFIDNCNRPIKLGEFMRYCGSVGMWDVQRRNASSFIQVIKEHNSMFLDRGKE